MQTNSRLWLIGATLILLGSCNKSNTLGKHIPREAGFVMQINGKELSAKLSWEELKQNPFFKDANTDSSLPAPVKLLLNNPDSAGIDASDDLLFFATKDSMGGYAAFEGTIKNEVLFKSFNKQLATNGTESDLNGIHYITKGQLALGFSKDKFVYLFDSPSMNQMDALTRRMQQDSIDIPLQKTRDIGGACKAIFALEEDNSLAGNEKFSRLLKEKGDVHLFINGETLMSGISGNPMMAMIDIEKFYKGNIITAAINFEKGKISVDAKSYIGDDITKIYKKYSGGKINDDMVKRMPGKDIIGLLAINFKPEVIKDFLKMMNLDGMANIGLAKVGFTLDDFIKANKGDIVFGVSDLTLKLDSSKNNLTENDKWMMQEKPVFTYVFATAIDDKDAFNKLINAGKKLGADKLTDAANPPFAYKMDGNYFTIANNKENADKYIAGTNTNVDFINKINGQPFGGYLNIQSLLKTFNNKAAKDSNAKVVYDASIKLWDNVTLKGGDMNNDGAITQSVEINLIDKTTNSLKQLNQYAGILSGVYKKQKQLDKDNLTAFNNADTTVVFAPNSTKNINKKYTGLRDSVMHMQHVKIKK